MNLFKTIDGVEIFITDDGKFQAKIKGEILKRASLKAIENALHKDIKSIPAYRFRSWSIDKPFCEPIKRFEGYKARLENGKLANRYETFYSPTSEQLKELEEIYKLNHALEERYRRILERLKRITPENIDTLRTIKEKDHEQKEKGKRR